MAINNTIHRIRFTVKKYTVPIQLLRDYLLSENNLLIITEDGKKIILG